MSDEQAVACPACEASVAMGHRTMGTVVSCPHCHVAFMLVVERSSASTFNTRAIPVEGDGEVGPEVAARFEILGLLGKGGQGAVYRVRPRGTPHTFALKYFRAAATLGTSETAIVSRLDHPNIVALHAAGTDGAVAEDGAVRRYAVYEIVEGSSLSALIEAGPLDVRRALAIALDVLEGLAHSHRQGVVHRDIKPDNILIRDDGVPKIADFGIGLHVGDHERLVPAGDEPFMGTPAYAAPEQINGQGAIRASDVYALGNTLYHTLTGRLPFVAPSVEILLHHQANTPPPPPSRYRPDLPPSLEALILRCLAKDPRERPSSAIELLAELRVEARKLGVAVPLKLAEEHAVPPAVWSPDGLALAGGRLALCVMVLGAPLAATTLDAMVSLQGMARCVPAAAGCALALALAVSASTSLTGRAMGWLEWSFLEDLVGPGALQTLAALALLGAVPLARVSLSTAAILQFVAAWLLVGPAAARWVEDALTARITAHQRGSVAVLAFEGPHDLAVALVSSRPDAGEVRLSRLPTRLVARPGRHELAVTSQGREQRYLVDVPHVGWFRAAFTAMDRPVAAVTGGLDSEGVRIEREPASVAGAILLGTLIFGFAWAAVALVVAGVKTPEPEPSPSPSFEVKPSPDLANVPPRRVPAPPRPRRPQDPRLGTAVGATGTALVPVVRDRLGDPLPEHAALRLGSSRYHFPRLRWMEFLPGGRMLAGASSNGGLMMMEVATGRVVWEAESDQPWMAGALSPDAKLLVTASSGRQVRASRTVDGRSVLQFDADEYQVTDVVWAPTGAVFATLSPGGTVGSWDPGNGHQVQYCRTDKLPPLAARYLPGGALRVATGTKLFTFQQDHEPKQTALEGFTPAAQGQYARFSRDVTRLLIASERNVWDVNAETGSRRRSFPVPNASKLAWSPDEARFAWVDGGARIGTMALAATRPTTIATSADPSCAPAWSPDGKDLAWLDTEGVVQIRDLSTGRTVTPTDTGPAANGVVALADGEHAVTMGWDGSVCTWDLRSGAPAGRPLPASGRRLRQYLIGDIECLRRRQDGRTVLLGPLPEVYDPAARTLTTTGGPIGSEDESPDGRWGVNIVDYRVHFRTVGRADMTVHLDGSACCARIADTGDLAVVRDTRGRAHVYDIDLRRIQVIDPGMSPDWYDARGVDEDSHRHAHLALSRDGRVVALHAGYTLQVFRIGGGRIASVPTPEHVRALCLSPDGGHLAVGLQTGQVELIDLSAPPAKPQPWKAHRTRVTGLDFTPDGTRLLSASTDGTVLVWPVPVSGKVKPVSPPGSSPGAR